jgi:hypothetical protein
MKRGLKLTEHVRRVMVVLPVGRDDDESTRVERADLLADGDPFEIGLALGVEQGRRAAWTKEETFGRVRRVNTVGARRQDGWSEGRPIGLTV